MSITIELNTPVNVVVVEETAIETNVVVVENFTDNGESVVATVSFQSNTGFSKQITLWEGEEYINVGQYTDTDIQNRITEILNT